MNYFVRMEKELFCQEAKLLKTHFQSGHRRVIEDSFLSFRCIQLPLFIVFDIKMHFEFRICSRLFSVLNTVFLLPKEFNVDNSTELNFWEQTGTSESRVEMKSFRFSFGRTIVHVVNMFWAVRMYSFVLVRTCSYLIVLWLFINLWTTTTLSKPLDNQNNVVPYFKEGL